MNIEQKILYYTKVKWNIPFRCLHQTIEIVCEWVKPIFPNINPLKYIEFFFIEIDWDKIAFYKTRFDVIDNSPSKTEMRKYCYAIYYGLEQLLKADISEAILIYQNNISNLSKEQRQETQIKLIVLIGNLKRQARTHTDGTSFTQHFSRSYKKIEAKNKLLALDYQILITHFRQAITNDLLSSFEIINETFNAITPLLDALPPQQAETKKFTAPVLGLFCGLINKIGIDKKEESESAAIYCKRICVKYKLHYTERVRQNYNVNENKKLIQDLTEKVLPLIDTETKSLIQKYLDSKHPPKQNLYA